MAIEILLVDDDEDTLSIASTYLKRDDPTFEITTAVSSEEAMAILRRRDFDVVVSDYMMPNGKSGLQFLEAVKMEKSEVPFIIFTGKGREEVAINALNLGADSYVTKGGDTQTVYAELAHTIRSVVAHRRAKLALDESDARFRAAFEDAAIGMAIISIDQEIIRVNHTLCDMLGFRTDELVGRNLEEIAHPDEIGQAPLKALRILDGEKAVLSGERRFLHRDGKWVWTRTTSSLARDSKGNPLCFVSQFLDITETKKAVEALKDSEMRFHGAFDDAAIGMALVDFNNKILDCNQALCQMLGYTKDEIIAMTFAELTHPDDLSKVPRVIDGRFEGGKKTVQLEKRYIHRSGHTVYTFVSSSIAYNENNEPIYFISQFQDVTEQRIASDALATSEANYRNLVEKSLQNYAIIQDGRYVYANQAFADTLGLPLQRILSLTAEEVWKHVHPDDIELLKQRDSQLQESTEAAPKGEFRYVQPNGDIRWVEGFIQLTEYDGRPATQIVEIDITERKLAYFALRNNLDFLDALLNTIPSPVFYKDKTGRIQRCNSAFASQVMGMAVEEIIGHGGDYTFEGVRGMSRERLQELDDRLYAGEADQSFEFQTISPDGSMKDYLVVRSAYADSSGNIEGIVGVMVDTTETRYAINQLKKERRSFRILAEAAVHAESVHDLSGRILRGLLDILEFDRGSILVLNTKTRMLDLVASAGAYPENGNHQPARQAVDDPRYYETGVITDGKAVFAPRIQEHKIYQLHEQSIRRMGIRSLLIWPLKQSTGEVHGVLQMSSVVEKDLTEDDRHFFEVIAGMLGMLLESQEADEALRRSEARFRLTFESIPEPSFLWELRTDNVLHLSMVNQAAIEMSEGRLIGSLDKSFKEILGDHPILVEKAYAAARTGASFRLEQELGSQGTDRKRWVIWNGTRPSENTLLLIAIDITQHRLLQESLSKQKEELSEFAQVMSHDLRQSLHNALLYAELLQDEYAQEHIDGIMDMITNAQEILKRSLTLAEAGRVIGEAEEVDLSKLVDEVASRDVNAPTVVSHDKLPVILCDRVKMAQILSNLFRNAVEHGDAKHIKIEAMQEKNQLEVLVTNDGRPIPQDLRDKVFKAQATRVKGRGLGLMIVRKLVEAHGWRIHLDTSEKTTFRITIPQKS